MNSEIAYHTRKCGVPSVGILVSNKLIRVKLLSEEITNLTFRASVLRSDEGLAPELSAS